MTKELTDRANVHRLFVARFSVRSISTVLPPFEDSDIRNIESSLCCTLPAAYRQFVQTYGAVWTPHLPKLDTHFPDGAPGIEEFAPVDGLLALNHAGWLATVPPHVSREAKPIHANIFKYLVGFASGSCGDYFCFPNSQDAVDDSPIYFFDHEFDETTRIAASFDALLSAYLDRS